MLHMEAAREAVPEPAQRSNTVTVPGTLAPGNRKPFKKYKYSSKGLALISTTPGLNPTTDLGGASACQNCGFGSMMRSVSPNCKKESLRIKCNGSLFIPDWDGAVELEELWPDSLILAGPQN